MPDTAFDRHDLDDMVHEPERWAERTLWVNLAERLDGATKQQLMQIARGGIGEPEQ